MAAIVVTNSTDQFWDELKILDKVFWEGNWE